MRALITAVGTRGDVQPALALARGLLARGHEVRMCTSPGFVDQARALGVDARAMGVEMRAPAGARPTPEQIEQLRRSMPDLITDQFDTVAAAAPGCDVVVGANAHQYAAPSIAEIHGIPYVTAVYAPVAVPNPEIAPPSPPGQPPSDGSVAERWRLAAEAWNARARERIDHNRARLGLGGVEDVLDHVLSDPAWLAADPVLASMPATDRVVHTVGAWFVAEVQRLSAEVEAFLDAGEAPVYVGFGSMPARPDLGTIALRAARAVGRRLVLQRGWADLELGAAPDCLVVDALDHDALFPRVAAVVHHGGAGTTHTAARAGAPQVVTPMFSDQPYWAARCEALGVGRRALPTEEGLAAALGEVLGGTAGDRARQLQAELGPSGVDGAIDRLEGR